MTIAFPLIAVSGEAHERGRQYGRAAGDRIRKSIEIYSRVFDSMNHGWGEIAQLARAYMPVIEHYEASYLEEIRGIAEGAQLEVEKIVALNARTELLYGNVKRALTPLEMAEGCTGVIALPEATAGGHVIHGQNWDWMADCADSAIVMRHELLDGMVFLSFNEAGMIARAGMNSSGVAVTGNFLACDGDEGRGGVPIPFVRRRVLTSGTFADAIHAIYSWPCAFSINMMISISSGQAIDFETTPGEVFWLQAEQGLLIHSNHFVSEAAKAKVRDTGILLFPDTLYRDQRVRELLRHHIGAIEVQHFKDALADSVGEPAAVCRAPGSGHGGSDCVTVATIIMDTTLGKMWIAPTPFDGVSAYAEYSIE